jgi:hypothetical protein
MDNSLNVLRSAIEVFNIEFEKAIKRTRLKGEAKGGTGNYPAANRAEDHSADDIRHQPKAPPPVSVDPEE